VRNHHCRAIIQTICIIYPYMKNNAHVWYSGLIERWCSYMYLCHF